MDIEQSYKMGLFFKNPKLDLNSFTVCYVRLDQTTF